MLVAMAPGTGKTRVALGMIYRMLHADIFHRIFFLVDRNFLGEQAEDKFTGEKIVDYLSLDSIFPMKKLGDPEFNKETHLKIATIQSMVRKVLGDDSDRLCFQGFFRIQERFANYKMLRAALLALAALHAIAGMPVHPNQVVFIMGFSRARCARPAQRRTPQDTA